MAKTYALQRLERQIVDYLRCLPPDILGVERSDTVEILDMTPGAYNLNYHVLVDGTRFIFRVNIQQQSGLANQVIYEYSVMRYLHSHQISPRVYHIDYSKSHFDFDILIEEYLEGPYISLVEEDMPSVAGLLAKLHSLDAAQVPLITWSNPLVDTYELVMRDYQEYTAKKSADPLVIRLTEEFLAKIRPVIDEKSALYAPDGINHTDVAIDNFIKSRDGLKLIDWEKPRFDDCSYDVCCFLSEPAQLWCVPDVLSEQGRQIFLQEYLRCSGRTADLFLEKVRIREPLVSLHWVYWGLNRLCDLKDRITASALQEVHEQRVHRWERIANPDHIEKLITMI